MRRHWNRSVYYVIGGKGVVEEPDFFLNGSRPPVDAVASAHKKPRRRAPQPIGKYGYMFGDLSSKSEQVNHDEMLDKLVKLGQSMNTPTKNPESQEEQSIIPAGYTYLGQFIAHEMSFDKTEAPEYGGSKPHNYRSPQIDLDSIYGRGPSKEPLLYQDEARLKVGDTMADGYVPRSFLNDLPRAGYGDDNPRKALIADARNDDNLALAQLHVAFARFHNRIVDSLQQPNKFHKLCGCHPAGCPPMTLFECARREVIQHFQAIILFDFLPRILDESGLKRLQSGRPEFYDINNREGMFMPLEFSVAAFRFGHSMVRSSYEWNFFQSSERLGAPTIRQLFDFTQFSGDLGQSPRLSSDWIIDWQRFYDFTEMGYDYGQRKRNFARKIDTSFNLHLDKIPGYPHVGFPVELSSITVRNLLRGYSLDLPSGEQVAECIKAPQRLSRQEIIDGRHEAILRDPIFEGRTPLWYYVLREAEINNQNGNTGKLGSVGSCIVAETLLGLIKKSHYSILNDPTWRPKFGTVKPETGQRYRMIDLLKFAGVIDPVGEFLGKR